MARQAAWANGQVLPKGRGQTLSRLEKEAPALVEEIRRDWHRALAHDCAQLWQDLFMKLRYAALATSETAPGLSADLGLLRSIATAHDAAAIRRGRIFINQAPKPGTTEA